MIFKLDRSTSLLIMTFSGKIIELFHPFSNNSENAGSLNEENSVLDLQISVFWSIFGNFATNHIRRIASNFLSILGFFGVYIATNEFMDVFNGSFAFRKVDLLKNTRHDFFKLLILFLSFFDHVIYGLHDTRRIILIFPEFERYVFRFF